MTHMTKDLDGICDMKDALMRKVRGKMDDLDVERSTIQDVQGMDMMINMIHHLAEAEKCCWEACYYKTVIKAMKEGDDREGRDEDDDDEEWITIDDLDELNHYLYNPYEKLGGNGYAKKIHDEVLKLPVYIDPPVENKEDMNERGNH